MLFTISFIQLDDKVKKSVFLTRDLIKLFL